MNSDRQSARHSPRPENRRAWAAALLLATVLGLAFQGSRGLWEPDEGFYSNVAMAMVQSGDYWIPHLNGEPFLDKPPVVYWSIAIGTRLLPNIEWGARLAHALWYVATAFLVGLLAAEIGGPQRGPEAVAAYSLMLAPFIAANTLTPDTPLVFGVVAMALATWRLSLSASWMAGIALGVAMGFAFLTKGPATLVFLFPMICFLLWRGGWRRLVHPATLLAGGLGLALGGSWYWSVMHSVPGALEYIIDNQVTGRLWSGHYNRNADALGAVRIYLPMLLLGCLPWSASWGRKVLAFRLPTSSSLIDATARWRREVGGVQLLFLGLMISFPIIVFSLARSRLPFYILPVFPFIAIVVALTRRRSWGVRPVMAWVVVLISIKLALSVVPFDHDSRQLAADLRGIGARNATLIVAIEGKHNGLASYGFSQLEWVRLGSKSYPYFSLLPTFEDFLAKSPFVDSMRYILVLRPENLSAVEENLKARAVTQCHRKSTGQGRVLLDCDPNQLAAASRGQVNQPFTPPRSSLPDQRSASPEFQPRKAKAPHTPTTAIEVDSKPSKFSGLP